MDKEKQLRALVKRREKLEQKIFILRNELHIKCKREKRINASILKSEVEYIPETGCFLRKRHTSRRNVGERAGGVSKGDGYRRISIRGIAYMEHRLAFLYMTGKWPQFIVDHINGIRDDNRWCNLRHVTWSINNAVRQTQSNNTSGFRGVSLHRSGRWRASLVMNNRQVYHKLFSTKEEAAAAYATAYAKYYGFSMDEAPSVLKH